MKVQSPAQLPALSILRPGDVIHALDPLGVPRIVRIAQASSSGLWGCPAKHRGYGFRPRPVSLAAWTYVAYATASVPSPCPDA